MGAFNTRADISPQAFQALLKIGIYRERALQNIFVPR